jgi:hypothetical protein
LKRSARREDNKSGSICVSAGAAETTGMTIYSARAFRQIFASATPAGEKLQAAVIARSQRVRPLAGPMINSATKQSSLCSVALDCFAEPVIGRRGACHRARIRATR